MKAKILSDQEARQFILNLERAEVHENFRCYCKGVRVALINLGFDESWVNGRFYDLMVDWVNDVDE